MRVPSRTEPVGTVHEVRLEDRLDHQEHGHLSRPVPHRWNPERAQLAVRLRYVDTTHGSRPIGLRAEVFFELVEKTRHATRSGLDVFEADPVDTRGPAVLAHPSPCRLEDVTSVNAVVQRVEPERRFLLGLSA